MYKNPSLKLLRLAMKIKKRK